MNSGYSSKKLLLFFCTIVTILLLATNLEAQWQQGFDFRSTAAFVADPPGDTYVLATTAYPTKGNGVTYGWARTYPVGGRDRNAKLDPRLAGINYANNGTQATFYVDLPSPGTYNLSLALGGCWLPGMLDTVPDSVPRWQHGAVHRDRRLHCLGLLLRRRRKQLVGSGLAG